MSQYLEYYHQGAHLEAYISYPENDLAAKMPAVIVLHAWRGRDQFACSKATEFSQKGYIGVALDVYGKGIIGNSVEENEKLMSPFLKNRSFLAERLLAGLQEVKRLPKVDPNKIIIIGYCFGGLCALDILRNKADIAGIISIHGILVKPTDYICSYSAAVKVLILTGYKDPLVPAQQLLNLQEELSSANLDWQVLNFGNAYHAFTDIEANDLNRGSVYNFNIAARSDIAINEFIKEIVGVSHG